MRAFKFTSSFISFAIASMTIAPIQNAYALDRAKLMDAFLSVVMIRGYNATGGLAYGSGVVVADNKVITNCHALRATKQQIGRAHV